MRMFEDKTIGIAILAVAVVLAVAGTYVVVSDDAEDTSVADGLGTYGGYIYIKESYGTMNHNLFDLYVPAGSMVTESDGYLHILTAREFPAGTDMEVYIPKTAIAYISINSH